MMRKRYTVMIALLLLVTLAMLAACQQADDGLTNLPEQTPGTGRVTDIESPSAPGFATIEILNGNTWPDPLEVDGPTTVEFINRGNASVRLAIDAISVEEWLTPDDRLEIVIDESATYLYDQQTGDIIVS